MELAQRELGLQVVERPIDRSELYICDELFFTGTAVGLAPVVRVDHRPVKDGAIGRSRASCSSCTSMRRADIWQTYRKWLVPVYATHEPEARAGCRVLR